MATMTDENRVTLSEMDAEMAKLRMAMAADISDNRAEMRQSMHEIDLRVADSESHVTRLFSEVRMHRELILVMLAGLSALCWSAF
jgi:hypothetical protein